MRTLIFLSLGLFFVFFFVYDAKAGIDYDGDRWWVRACVEAGNEQEVCDVMDDPIPDEFLEWLNSLPVIDSDYIDIDDVVLPSGLAVRQLGELNPEFKAETEARKKELERETMERHERSERIFREREEAMKQSESNKVED